VNGSDVDYFDPETFGQAEFFFPNMARRPYSGVVVPMGNTFDPYAMPIALPQGTTIPGLRLVPSPTTEGDRDSASAGDTEVPEPTTEEVVDPDVVYEGEAGEPVFEPGNEWYERTGETDWGTFYDDYVVLNNPEDVEVAIDWGGLFADVAGTVVGGWLDPFGAGAATTNYLNPPAAIAAPSALVAAPSPVAQPVGVSMAAAAGCGPTGPKYAKICLATGVVTPLRRRRRRRLLTSSDIKDLSALKSIVGGAALQGAVVQAVRR